MCVRHNDTRRLIICSNELLKVLTNESRDNVDERKFAQWNNVSEM